MTISQLTKELKKYKNQGAKVLITIGNEDNDSLSTSEFELCNQDESNGEYMEFFVHETECIKQL
jgi:hypothetical protein